MRAVLSEDLDWIRRDTPAGRTIRSVVPAGFESYALVDRDGVTEHEQADDTALLEVLAGEHRSELIARWIVKSDLMSEPGDEHDLYARWPYRLRRIDVGEVRSRIEDQIPDGFPDLLFPDDRSWIVSTAWDDAWRSIGASTRALAALAARCPRLEMIDPSTDIGTTGRELW